MRSNHVPLNCGITMPVIGLGTYSFQNDRKTTELAVHMALKVQTLHTRENSVIPPEIYLLVSTILGAVVTRRCTLVMLQHFDTAKIYGSEPALGNALTMAMHDGEVEREDIFVTSKLWGSDHHDPVAGLKQTLKNMGMEYLDMYLAHWPVKLKPWACNPIPDEDEFEPLDFETTWSGMQKCLDLGLCRCMGVSNFSTKKIEQLLDFASVPPAVNQVEMHPMWMQRKLRDFCREHNIHVSAYSPLGGPGNSWGSMLVVKNPIIRAIANKHKATPAQVALRWGLSQGSSMIVKSFSPERIKENFGAFDLKLDCQDFMEIDKLDERKIMRGEFLVNETTSPYKTIQDLWDDEI